MTVDRLWRVAARRWPAAMALLLLVTLVAAACGGGGGGDDDDADRARTTREDRDGSAQAQAEPGAQAVEQADAEPGGSAAPAAPRVSGELRIARQEPITLDPALVTDATSASYVVELFSGLVTLDQDLNIVPDLAEALPEVIDNPDGTVTYRFVLRRDALFHNNRRVTADDVKWSLERNASPDTFSPTAQDYLGDIVGARDYIRGRIDAITGVEVIDERTIAITVDAPREYFLAKLTYPTAFVVDRQQVEADPQNWARDPNGTGPFRVQEWQLGEQMVLVPFDRYHLGPATIDAVRIRFAGGAVTQYENDEVDIAGVGVNDIERVRDPADSLNAEFVNRAELSVSYIGFNVRQPPFNDPLVRQAFGMALDKLTLQEVVLMGALPVAEGILPPGILAYDPDFRGLPFDPELARELLDDSSYAGRLPTVRLTISGLGATPGPVIEAMQQMWLDNLGVEVQIQQVETATFYSELDRGLYQMFNIGWIADYPDPENFLDLLFHSRSLQNNTGYSNPDVDAILEAARVESDLDERIRLYRQAETVIVQDAPWLPLFFGQANELVKPYVQGYTPPRIVIPYLRFITLTE